MILLHPLVGDFTRVWFFFWGGSVVLGLLFYIINTFLKTFKKSHLINSLKGNDGKSEKVYKKMVSYNVRFTNI